MKHKYNLAILVSVLCLMMSILSPSLVGATPQAPGAIPPNVGVYENGREICRKGDILASWASALVAAGLNRLAVLVGLLPAQWTSDKCTAVLDGLKELYRSAYAQAESEGASPGSDVNSVHYWNGVMIQDFSGGNWGDGAIIFSEKVSKITKTRPQYVGGGAWNAFKRAANSYQVWPGAPINTEHDWNKVRIQDFRGGAWGDGAIIGGGNAELVAGNHWKAYIRADGSNKLRNPKTFMVQQYYGFEPSTYAGPKKQRVWWVQYFDGGEIWESRGDIRVYYKDSNTWQNFRV